MLGDGGVTLASLLVIGVLAAAALRLVAVYAWGKPEVTRGFAGDASVHFAIIRHLARSARSRFIENYLISPAPMSYPIAFHRFAGLLSTSLLSRKPWLPNMILHVLGTGLPGDRRLADVGRLYRRRRRDRCDIPDDAEHVGILLSRHRLSGAVGEAPGAPQQLGRLSGAWPPGPCWIRHGFSGLAQPWRLLPFSAPNSRGRLSSSVCRFSAWYCWMRGPSCSCF